MKKHLTMFSAWVLAALFCVACGSSAEPNSNTSSTESQPIAYSNLVDSSVQKEVADFLEGHGVSKEQTETLVSWADDFNSRVTAGKLPEGFCPMDEKGADYSGLIIQNKEAEDGFIYPEANCRLTSYLLMKNLIETNGKHADNDTFLMFDVEAIDTYEPFNLDEKERTNFISLFSWVPVGGANQLEEHVARFEEAWKERDVKIGGKGISLITVYVHSPFDEVRIVGHTGILLDAGEELLFVEKYGPQLPFQATKFHDRKELKEYLLGRADLYGDEKELAPLVFENNQLL